MSLYTESAEWQCYLNLMASRPADFLQSEQLRIITEPDVVNGFVLRTCARIGVVYQSPWNIFVVDLVQNPSGKLFTYERLLPASVGVPVVTVPVCNERYILLNQYRHAIRGTQWSFPRGFGEDGLSAAENACKELSEEIGAVMDITAVKELGTVYSDSGMSGCGVRVLLCPVQNYELKSGYEGIVNLAVLSAEEIEQWISSGRLNDGFSLSAWTLLKTPRNRVDNSQKKH